MEEKKININQVGERRRVNIWQRVLYYLQLRDGIWSLPLSFFLFWFIGLLLTWIFGNTIGVYDPSFIQPLFLAVLVAIGASNGSQFIMFFNYRTAHRYMFGKYEKQSKSIVNYFTKEFINLNPWQRILLSLFFYLFWVSVIILVFIKLI
jgi:hypothetical protein